MNGFILLIISSLADLQRHFNKDQIHNMLAMLKYKHHMGVRTQLNILWAHTVSTPFHFYGVAPDFTI